MDITRVQITTTCPTKDASALRAALAKIGAGDIGEYRDTSFSIRGKGRFTPTDDADPHTGEVGEQEVVEEEQINVICKRTQAKQIIAELRRVHPYEEPVIEIIPLLNESDL